MGKTKLLSALLLPLLLVGGLLSAPGPAEADVLDGRFPTEEMFVDQVFHDFLSRPADPAGLAFWADQLRAGQPPADLVEDLLLSPEFAGTTAPVVRLYWSIFDRQPDLGGLRFWVGRRQGGQSLTSMADQMLAAAEFQELSAAGSTEEIVAAVYGRSLGRTPDPSGLVFWIGEIEAGRHTLASFVATVSESPEHQALRRGDVTTTLVFLGLLQRTPDSQGLAFWSNQIEEGASISGVIESVMGAPEYLDRFPRRPSLTTEVIASDLSVPWDVETLPDGTVIFTERLGRLSIVTTTGETRVLNAPLAEVFARGETGLMGLAIDPGFTSNRRFYTCQGHASPRDVRVVAWTLDEAMTTATLEGPLVIGIPITSGRHGGCQLEFGADGYLWIGTGDSAIGSTPQDLTSLGGKVLRVDAADGQPAPDNPFISSANPTTQLIFTYGHRNVQGLAARPGTEQMWSVEHGPTRDDEVSLLPAGGNGGWNPVPGYNESVSMTNLSLPNAFGAAWSTGSPTLALSGGEWFDHPSWGSWNGGLAVAALKNQTLRLLFFSPEGAYLGQETILDGEFGRLRAVQQGADGAIYVTTSRGNDDIIRLTGS